LVFRLNLLLAVLLGLNLLLAILLGLNLLLLGRRLSPGRNSTRAI